MERAKQYMAGLPNVDMETQNDVLGTVQGKNYYNAALHDCLFDFLADHGSDAYVSESTFDELVASDNFNAIPMTAEQKTTLILNPMWEMYNTPNGEA